MNSRDRIWVVLQSRGSRTGRERVEGGGEIGRKAEVFILAEIPSRFRVCAAAPLVGIHSRDIAEI